jgi:hypothetical protein
LQHDADVAENERERIVDLVGDARRESTERRQPIGTCHPLLELALFAHVTKHDDCTPELAVLVHHGRHAVLDGHVALRARERVAHGASDRASPGKCLLDRHRRRLARPLVHPSKHVLQAAADQLCSRPPRQGFARPVDEGYLLFGIDRDHAILDRAQGGEKQALTVLELGFQAMLEDRDLDPCAQVAGSERLQDVAVGPCFAGTPQRLVIPVSRQKHDRHVEATAQQLRGVDAIHRALDPHVHQDQIGTAFARLTQTIRAARVAAEHIVAHQTQGLLDVLSDDSLVLHDHDRSH